MPQSLNPVRERMRMRARVVGDAVTIQWVRHLRLSLTNHYKIERARHAQVSKPPPVSDYGVECSGCPRVQRVLKAARKFPCNHAPERGEYTYLINLKTMYSCEIEPNEATMEPCPP